MNDSGDDHPGDKCAARRSKGRAARSSRSHPPDRSGAAQDEVPTSGLLGDHTARATDGPQGQEAQQREAIERYERCMEAMQHELPNSRAVRCHNKRLIEDQQSFLQQCREMREQLARNFEKLIARGSNKDAALLAFQVASIDRCIEGLERSLASADDLIVREEAFEAQVTQMAAGAELAHRGPEDAGLLTRVDRSREKIKALEHVFAQTKNPLYVWEALSLMCVPSIAGDTSDRCLPAWCIDYLGCAAEALLGLAPPGMLPEGELEGKAPAASKALGLTRQGWNAYQEKGKNRQSISHGAVYARVKALGISNKDALYQSALMLTHR